MARIGRLVKESLLKELSSELSERPSFLVTRVNRLSASEADTLRQKLCASKASLRVIQRRLGLRALASLKIQGLSELLEGSVGLVLPSDDLLLASKLIVEFSKAHEDHLSVRGAVVDGQLLDRSRVEQLASLPSRPMLLAQVVATIESPIGDVIFTIERLLGDIAWLAEQAASQKPRHADAERASQSGTTASPSPSVPESTQEPPKAERT